VVVHVVDPRWRDEGGHALHELELGHPDRPSTVAPGALQLELEITRGMGQQPLLRECRAGDITTQPFEPLPVFSADDDAHVEIVPTI